MLSFFPVNVQTISKGQKLYGEVYMKLVVGLLRSMLAMNGALYKLTCDVTTRLEQRRLELVRPMWERQSLLQWMQIWLVGRLFPQMPPFLLVLFLSAKFCILLHPSTVGS